MNELLELQKVLIENELRRHYIHELLGNCYEALVYFMLIALSNASSPTPPQSKSPQ